MKLAAGTALDLLGAEGLLWGDDAPEAGRYAELFNFVRCMSIAGGSDEIDKNVIGERALGLPGSRTPTRGCRSGTCWRVRRPPPAPEPPILSRRWDDAGCGGERKR